MHFHRAAGLTIASDRPIPGLSPAPAYHAPDLHVEFDAAPEWAGLPFAAIYSATGTNNRPIVEVDSCPSGYRFRYADATCVWVDTGAARVWCTRATTSSLEDVATYVVGPVLGFALRMRGALALHASAVEIDDCAIAFVGPHGAGKSTMAAALGRRGHAIVSDDVLRLRRTGSTWMAEPFDGVLRLWPEGARIALESCEGLPRITPTWNKRALAIGARGIRGVTRASRLGGIVFLEPRDSSDAPRLTSISPRDALLRLTATTSGGHLLDRRQRTEEFLQLSALVRDVRVAGIVAHEDPARFRPFIDLVLTWVSP